MTNSREDIHREFEQISAAEVPGFHARTVIDDTIGKLYALRLQLSVDLPSEVPALLDDLEALTERIVDLAYDKDTNPVEDGVYKPGLPDHIVRYCGSRLAGSGSSTLGWCSCGAPCIDGHDRF